MERSEEMIEKITDDELEKANGGSSIIPPVKPRTYAGHSPEQNNNSLNDGNNETLKGFVVGQVVDGNCIA
ncbi:MAG: hypothetical protein IKP31_05420 [Lachnospiraceae bacterium]|nr:hypothetical protein [Lachnospiraceae bacterium]